MAINYDDYHPKWHLISYLIRVRRAKNRCEWCDAENAQPHPQTTSKVVLTVAHLNRDRRLNRFWNLAALCQRCHLNWDRNAHIYSRRYGRDTRYLNLKLFEVPMIAVVPNKYFKPARAVVHSRSNYVNGKLFHLPPADRGNETEQRKRS